MILDVLSVRGASRGRLRSGADHLAGQPAGSMARRSRRGRRSRVGCGVRASCLASTAPDGFGSRSGSTTRACHLLAGWTRHRRTAGNRRDQAVQRHRACARKHRPDAEQTPRWARQCGDARSAHNADREIPPNPAPHGAPPPPRCFEGCKARAHRAARRIGRGCLTIRITTSASADVSAHCHARANQGRHSGARGRRPSEPGILQRSTPPRPRDSGFAHS